MLGPSDVPILRGVKSDSWSLMVLRHINLRLPKFSSRWGQVRQLIFSMFLFKSHQIGFAWPNAVVKSRMLRVPLVKSFTKFIHVIPRIIQGGTLIHLTWATIISKNHVRDNNCQSQGSYWANIQGFITWAKADPWNNYYWVGFWNIVSKVLSPDHRSCVGISFFLWHLTSLS